MSNEKFICYHLLPTCGDEFSVKKCTKRPAPLADGRVLCLFWGFWGPSAPDGGQAVFRRQSARGLGALWSTTELPRGRLHCAWAQVNPVLY